MEAWISALILLLVSGRNDEKVMRESQIK